MCLIYKMLDCDVYLRGSCLKMPTLFRKEGLLSSEVAVSIFFMILTQSTVFLINVRSPH